MRHSNHRNHVRTPLTAESTSCQTISASVAMEVGDSAGSFTMAMDESELLAAAQGKTLVMCQLNEFMRGQYGLNIGGISVLTNAILADHVDKQVGFRSVGGTPVANRLSQESRSKSGLQRSCCGMP
jgi:hypothetical protein